ncbi:MAG TPA: hypothetical protein VFM15_09560 [Gammaproteobacteria bacterium]|nr:hypothetical protein [Gammaproteobacteria bacterium]
MKTLFKWLIVGGAALLGLWTTAANAMPSYARQTGLDCNSCHIGFQAVPYFTRTGRLFIMRGFHQPNSIQGKLRETGYDHNNKETPEYGGNYLALNWTDFLSARFITQFASGGKSPGGGKRDVTANPGSRLALFFTGPVNDWLGVWTEIGYLGNQSLKAANTSTTAGQSPGQPTNVNFFAYDEYRLTASKMLSDGNSFIGMAYGNEQPDAINEFVFPNTQVRPWSYGQGGVGNEYSIATYSFYGFWNNSILTQYSIVSGDSDTSFSNGHNNYIALAYDGVPGTGDTYRRESNDIWWLLDTLWGDNVGSQVNSTNTSFICTAACPAGIKSLGFSNRLGSNWVSLGDLLSVNGTGYETVDSSHAFRLTVQQSVADMGNNSWYQSVALARANQDYVSGASSKATKLGYQIRYFYNRTYGFEFFVNKTLTFDYTDPLGVKYSAYAPVSWGLVGLWAPAMNMNVALSYSPSKTPVLNRANYQSGGYSWNFLLDFGF